ncbi:hypothetical protein CDAR_62941 [Caerostris darwini]|uniref:Uncharacterized protein n=1 Tax=Caerostris darwini TaxID=1538125 RepID=A0AAV4UFH3_9ARAC|nr:hypothetical protein CDAR_62941 [Caerostris darwini]
MNLCRGSKFLLSLVHQQYYILNSYGTKSTEKKRFIKKAAQNLHKVGYFINSLVKYLLVGPYHTSLFCIVQHLANCSYKLRNSLLENCAQQIDLRPRRKGLVVQLRTSAYVSPIDNSLKRETKVDLGRFFRGKAVFRDMRGYTSPEFHPDLLVPVFDAFLNPYIPNCSAK